MKQYFYNPKITNYGYTPETQIYNFIMGFQNISHYIAETIEVTSKTNCFLMDKYINFFSKYFYSNFSELIFSFLKPFYSNLMEIIDKMFYDYDYGKQSTVVLTFSIMMIVVSLYFWIVWKKYEDEFIDSIEKSFDLINLIPEEIKNILVAKLNENN
jgi:hypothetical protein